MLDSSKELIHSDENFLKKYCRKFGVIKKLPYLCIRLKGKTVPGALSSAGSERLPYKQRVGGSNPSAPTTIKVPVVPATTGMLFW